MLGGETEMVDDMKKILNMTKSQVDEYQQKAAERDSPPQWFVEIAKLPAG